MSILSPPEVSLQMGMRADHCQPERKPLALETSASALQAVIAGGTNSVQSMPSRSFTPNTISTSSQRPILPRGGTSGTDMSNIFGKQTAMSIIETPDSGHTSKTNGDLSTLANVVSNLNGIKTSGPSEPSLANTSKKTNTPDINKMVGNRSATENTGAINEIVLINKSKRN